MRRSGFLVVGGPADHRGLREIRGIRDFDFHLFEYGDGVLVPVVIEVHRGDAAVLPQIVLQIHVVPFRVPVVFAAGFGSCVDSGGCVVTEIGICAVGCSRRIEYRHLRHGRHSGVDEIGAVRRRLFAQQHVPDICCLAGFLTVRWYAWQCGEGCCREHGNDGSRYVFPELHPGYSLS